MTAAPLTLTSFLLARIAEDEAVANYAASEIGDPSWRAAEEAHEGIAVWSSSGRDYGHESNTTDHIARHDPARVLADCAAKRAVVEAVSTWTHMTVEDAWYSCAATYGMDLEDANCNDANEGRGCDCGLDRRVASLLNPLATVYDSHPNYDPAWRP